MPAQPAWFHRLDEILSALRSMTSTHLDRAAVEKLFRVRRRRARQIMAGLKGLRDGNAAAVSREALIARLEPMVASPDSSLVLAVIVLDMVGSCSYFKATH